jgi:3D (Asp-Asp-Asp) domain-containing protein
VSWIAVVSTAYCLSGVMADGTSVRSGSVAENTLRLGTAIEVSAAPSPARRFVVRDRIGWGTQLDFWVPSCSDALRWGRRVVRIRVWSPRELRVKARVKLLVHHHRAAQRAQEHAHHLSAQPHPFHPPEAR